MDRLQKAQQLERKRVDEVCCCCCCCCSFLFFSFYHLFLTKSTHHRIWRRFRQSAQRSSSRCWRTCWRMSTRRRRRAQVPPKARYGKRKHTFVCVYVCVCVCVCVCDMLITNYPLIHSPRTWRSCARTMWPASKSSSLRDSMWAFFFFVFEL